MSPNKFYFICITIVLNLPSFIAGYAVSYSNQVQPCLNAKFKWETDKEKSFWGSLIGSSVILGFTIGAIISSCFLKNGRRKYIIIASIIAIVGISLCAYLNIYFILFGRMIFGLACGIY